MTDQLHISKTLSVPRSIAARTVFVAGTKGSGKTYTAGVLAEEMLAAGIHVLVLDPLGVWYGLRHDASGGPGGYPIVILGGEHADVPLLPTGGEAVAEYVVRSGQSCIVDMSGFDSDAEQDRFVTALLKRLYRLKATDKAALHLLMDEADMFAPQQPVPGQQVMLGATKTIVTKGRSRGLSMTMITQRPQSISTALRDEADVFLCHRIQGPRAADAVRGWVEQHASKDEVRAFMDSLATLDTGECWGWSPHFLKRFERVKVRAKRTFDSSRTPDPGETARKPKAAAKVDLDKLTAEMRATAEAVKASDPAALRKRLAELERQLADRPAAVPPKVERVEVPAVSPAAIKRVEDVVGRMEREGQRRVEAAEALRVSGEQLQATAREFSAALRSASAPVAAARAAALPSSRAGMPVQAPRIARLTATGDGPSIGKCERSILAVLAQHPGGCEAGKLALLSGYRWTGGFRNSLSALRTSGLIEGENSQTMRLTTAGHGLGPFDSLPVGQALVDYWLNNSLFGACERAILSALVKRPDGMTGEQLTAATGYGWTGGFRNALSTLRTAGLLVGKNSEVMRAADELLTAAI